MRIFKYMDHFGVDVLRSFRLKVTPPNELNDPFEFSPCLAPEPITEKHVVQIINNTPLREVYDEMLKSGEKLPPYDRFEKIAKTIPPKHLADAIPLFQKSCESLVAENLNLVSRVIGLTCLTEEENSILMWSHYTDSHKGLVIEFDTSHKYFQEYSNLIEVKYAEKRVIFDPIWASESPEFESHCGEVLSTKNHAWAYEKERRLLFTLKDCHQILHEGRTLYFADIPKELILRVILGYRCPDHIARQILELRSATAAKYQIAKACLHPSEFSLEYQPLKLDYD